MHIEAVFPFKIQIRVHTSLTLLMWQKASNCFCREHKSSWRWAGWLFSDDDAPSKNLSLFFSSSPKAWSYLDKRERKTKKRKNLTLFKKLFYFQLLRIIISLTQRKTGQNNSCLTLTPKSHCVELVFLKIPKCFRSETFLASPRMAVWGAEGRQLLDLLANSTAKMESVSSRNLKVAGSRWLVNVRRTELKITNPDPQQIGIACWRSKDLWFLFSIIFNWLVE